MLPVEEAHIYVPRSANSYPIVQGELLIYEASGEILLNLDVYPR